MATGCSIKNSVLKNAVERWRPARGDLDGRVRARRGEAHRGTISPAEWPDAAYGDQAPDGKCPLGFGIGLMSSVLSGQCRILQSISEFSRELVKGSSGVEVYAFCEMTDRVGTLLEF